MREIVFKGIHEGNTNSESLGICGLTDKLVRTFRFICECLDMFRLGLMMWMCISPKDLTYV